MKIRKAVGTVLGVLLLAAGPALKAQGTGNVFLEAREEVFYMMAALQAAGYRPAVATEESRLLHRELQTALYGVHAPSVEELRTFYEEHRIAEDPGASFAQYISLALLLGSAPDFDLKVQQRDLPPDAKRVAEFVPLLKKFYEEARLSQLWVRFEPHYRKEIGRYSPLVRRAITEVDAYLRLPAGGYLGRNFRIFLELLGSPSLVQARIYRSDYFVVVTPLEEPRLEQIRHQYLHFVLDPLAGKYVNQINRNNPLLQYVQQAPLLGREYKMDYPLLATESLIRAVELRLSRPDAVKGQAGAKKHAAEGFILAPYFYSALQIFEKQPQGMTRYFRPLFEEMEGKALREQLEAIEFTQRAEPLAPVLSERERDLLKGNRYISEGKFLDARMAFLDMLEKYGEEDGEMLLGMGIASSNLRKPGLAQRYLKKALEFTGDARVSTWSHVFLGRIHDLMGRRREALAQYEAALVTAGAYPLALQAAQQGLKKPFGTL